MTDERLRLAMPDDQVCQTCHAVVLDMGAHEQYHVGLADFVRQRIEGVERHIRANAQQAMDLIGIEQRDREAVLGNHVARMEGIERGLASVWPRLRGVEDELSGRVAALTEEAPLDPQPSPDGNIRLLDKPDVEVLSNPQIEQAKKDGEYRKAVARLEARFDA